ncbi:GTP-binding protein [Winogradskyella arenosi]|uniref:GTP-binding protein n=1 Tax=Winogradskyella arenosi TaxID=533325 RepID=A0A368ZER7_9FLAO|nr:GTP-binding protein [Winogradskyella arenosi]RCW91669.1 hypothetical protein DFQ08_103505 [Winogradskyella arenosi]
MKPANDPHLRPRFKLEIAEDNKTLLACFESLKKEESKFIISRVDDHVFIRFPKCDQHFWSPQLHLEITTESPNKATIRGLFGPSPTVWTLFMFLHFIVAALGIGCGLWAYTNASLDKAYALPLSLAVLMIIVWILLYILGRLGRHKGQDEMKSLYTFMEDQLKAYF